ncbi:MAG: BON domain-containing protein [Acidobacteriaceae bacterium]|nr:BON domain-containing protein [Acidobacteriaceae bacterium]
MDAEPLRPTRKHDSIREHVLSELRSDPRITSSDITVEEKEGLVRLCGSVSSYWERDEAEKAAERVSGVRVVTNDLKVKLTMPRADQEIARDVAHALASHVAIPYETIKIKVENGWVTLEGTVDWPYQKLLAEAAVKGLRGVIGITNNIDHRAKY